MILQRITEFPLDFHISFQFFDFRRPNFPVVLQAHSRCQDQIMAPSTYEMLVQSGLAIRTQIPSSHSLFKLGDECDHYVIVETGRIRVELLSTNGQQLLLYRISEGQSCVMTTSCLLGENRYFAQATSETPANLFLIPRNNFRSLLIESSEFRNFVFDGFSERLSSLMQRTAELATNTVDQRLAASLLANAQSQGKLGNESNGSTVHLTHEQLAIEIGSAREVVSRRLAAFEKIGIIKRHRGHVEILDQDNLVKHLSLS